jgi:ferredoxin
VIRGNTPKNVVEEKKYLNDESVKNAAGGYYEKNGLRYYSYYGVDGSLCTGCQACGSVCPTQCISFSPFASIDDDVCVQCESCADACPTNAIGWKTRIEKIEE